MKPLCIKGIKQKKRNENQIIKKVSFVGISGNVTLALLKLFAGIYGKSGALISDSIHSLSDVCSTFIAFFGVKMSKRSSDKQHPYGHERFECVASLFLGIILLLTGLGIGKTGLANIFSGNYDNLKMPTNIALIAALISIVMKEVMYHYTKYYAKKLNSAAFMADAWHHRTDAFSSIGLLIGIGAAMSGFPVLDSAASVIICIFILKVAYNILKDAFVKMLDTSCGESYDNKLSEYIRTCKGVVSIDLLQSRMFGNRVYVDLEIGVDGDKSLREAHEVAENIHCDIERNFSEIKHIMVHVNPAD